MDLEVVLKRKPRSIKNAKIIATDRGWEYEWTRSGGRKSRELVVVIRGLKTFLDDVDKGGEDIVIEELPPIKKKKVSIEFYPPHSLHPSVEEKVEIVDIEEPIKNDTSDVEIVDVEEKKTPAVKAKKPGRKPAVKAKKPGRKAAPKKPVKKK